MPMVALALVAVTAHHVFAQRDSVNLLSGRSIRGQIESTRANYLTVDDERTKQEIGGWEIARVRFADEPDGMLSARMALAELRYDSVLQTLNALPPLPESELIRMDAAYLRAVASAGLALSGGNVTISQAKEELKKFYETHPDSWNLDTALKQYADLTFAEGAFDEAARMYGQLANSPAPEIAFESSLALGRSLILAGKHAEAAEALKAAEAIDSAEEFVVQGKLIARCLRAEAMALAGNAAEARSIAEDVIANNDARNTVLFGYAYNALGTACLQEEKLKEASRAFLHTDLLFNTDLNAHARALSRLNEIWSELGRNDRALEARQKLNERYRNTFWSKQ